MGQSESRVSPEMAVALPGIGVATLDLSAITPLSTSEQTALQNLVFNGGAAIMAIVYLTDSSPESVSVIGWLLSFLRASRGHTVRRLAIACHACRARSRR
jgi:hypothetical protein